MKKKTLLALLGGLFGVFYILNPTAGVLELIPDNIPFIGNMDEAAAVVLILGALRHFGIDLTRFFNKDKDVSKDVKDQK